MSGTLFLERLKRYFRILNRRNSWTLPERVPAPFIVAENIQDVHDYFSRSTGDQSGLTPLEESKEGFCYVCKEDVVFGIDIPADGSPVNWRETLTCPKCHLINRWRSCLHVFEVICRPASHDRIYLTETLSPIYQNLSGRFPELVASEYFPDHEPGELVQTHIMPVRNEDVTRLSLADASTDTVLCFDVLEHVPDYQAALQEFYRVLDKNGLLVLSVPFSFQHETNVRARIDAEGNIEHLDEPHYHGDPLSDQGVLSFYDFGMELLDDFRAVGFNEANLLCYRSVEFAYLGENVIYIARKH